MGTIKLKDVTLICADCVDADRAIEALQKCSKNVEFAAVRLITSDRALEKTDMSKWSGLLYQDVDLETIEHMESVSDYSLFMVKELYKHFDTSHVLVCQHDGFVVNPSAWTSEFLDYDYLGAVWWWLRDAHRDKDGNPYGKVYQGNGGFSLRSKKLQELAGKSDVVQKTHPEDGWLCTVYDEYFASLRCRWAPFDLCEQFSIESRYWPASRSFGHHCAYGIPDISVRKPQKTVDT